MVSTLAPYSSPTIIESPDFIPRERNLDRAKDALHDVRYRGMAKLEQLLRRLRLQVRFLFLQMVFDAAIRRHKPSVGAYAASARNSVRRVSLYLPAQHRGKLDDRSPSLPSLRRRSRSGDRTYSRPVCSCSPGSAVLLLSRNRRTLVRAVPHTEGKWLRSYPHGGCSSPRSAARPTFCLAPASHSTPKTGA